MKTLENENEKVHRICEHLRKEALEPAERQAAELIQNAKDQADEIILKAEKEAEEILNKTKLEIQREKNVFQSSLAQGAKQALEMLRQEIAEKFFNPQLEALIVKETTKPDVIAKIIEALLQGITGNRQVYVPKDVPADEVNRLLLNSLEGQSVAIGDFKGGAKVRLLDKNMTLEMTDAALKELLADYIRTDLRKFIFNA